MPTLVDYAQGVWSAHQHFFSFRLDVDVMESDLVQLAQGSFSNAFDKQKSALTEEGARDAQLERKWCVMSSTQTNVVGERPAYTLEPGPSTKPLSRADYPGLTRAQFAKHALWVTRCARARALRRGALPQPGQQRGRSQPLRSASREAHAELRAMTSRSGTRWG